ncbi:WD repeat domain-containing protein [Rutstroemia sp. NJR-2017a WRK4]|nr:WD repeat domain-containing protein [Rutstroemia sp. NJR-2017a WRK4]
MDEPGSSAPSSPEATSHSCPIGDERDRSEKVQVNIANDEDPDGTESDAERSEPHILFTLLHIILLIFRFVVAQRRRQILRLLANTDIARLFRLAADDDDDELSAIWSRRQRRERPDPDRFPKVPSDVGEELMASGDFGSNDTSGTDGQIKRRKRLARRILDRELASGNFASQKINQRMMAQEMLPSSNADMIINYNQPVYSGQFSDDGNFFFAVNKDFRVRMYDTSNPYKWRYYKTVDYPYGQFTLFEALALPPGTLTDASLSPDNKYLAYTSIRSTVCLAPTDPNDMGDPYHLDLADTGNGRNPNLGFRSRSGGSFGIWSIRFSGDGRELVAGTTGGSIVVYDIESRRSLHRIFGHEEDVNAVCFADKSSPHILYSGSDDTTLKVWDTRSMGDSREAGAFVGHIEGLTYIDSKGDGRYVLSNGKDQSMKLWDLRMVMSPRKFGEIRSSGRRRMQSHYDYRWGAYNEDDWYQDPDDNSLVTFRGHRVLRTLIRCHFSPPGSTNSRYVYSGSEDGKVFIWNMDATLAGKVDVFNATKNTRPPEHVAGPWDNDEDEVPFSRWQTCVRDASWHPTAPMIVASAWNGYGLSMGTVTSHSWNDGAEDDEAEPKMGLRLSEKLEQNPRYYENHQSQQQRRSARLQGLRVPSPDNDEDFEDE